MKSFNNLLFYQQMPEIDDNNAYIVNVYGLKTKKELLYLFYKSLNFPDYFGFNWDALYDCFCYLNLWIKEKKILVVHNGLPNLDDKDLKTYIEVLIDACEYWKRHPDILEMKVYFHIDYKNMIQDVLETK